MFYWGIWVSNSWLFYKNKYILDTLFSVGFFMQNNQNLQIPKQYTKEEIQESAIIIHPRASWYNITLNQIGMLFEEWSNLTQLKVPIYDEYGNEFWDSEWLYMSARTKNMEIKKMISFLSIWHKLARRSRDLFDLDNNLDNKIVYMREAIKKKFDANHYLKEKLLQTWNLQIIEYTYRWDNFFGIDQHDLIWSNVLWKLLMEYRDSCI